MDLITKIRIDNVQEAENILKAAGSEELLEKAHQDGDMHPNGKWVWVSSANGGKGDWRTLNGRAHKKHADTQASNKKQENNNKTKQPQGGTKSKTNNVPNSNNKPSNFLPDPPRDSATSWDKAVYQMACAIIDGNGTIDQETNKKYIGLKKHWSEEQLKRLIDDAKPISDAAIKNSQKADFQVSKAADGKRFAFNYGGKEYQFDSKKKATELSALLSTTSDGKGIQKVFEYLSENFSNPISGMADNQLINLGYTPNDVHGNGQDQRSHRYDPINVANRVCESVMSGKKQFGNFLPDPIYLRNMDYGAKSLYDKYRRQSPTELAENKKRYEEIANNSMETTTRKQSARQHLQAISLITDAYDKFFSQWNDKSPVTISKTTSSSYFSKLSNSLIEKYSKKKESVSLSDIEEFYEDFLRDRSQEPTRKVYANEAKKTYDAIVANWNKPMSATKVDTTDKLKSVLAATDGKITLKITTNGSGVVKLSNSVNAKWQDVKDEDFGGRIIGVKIDGKLGAKTFPYSFDSMKRKKYGLYTFEEAKAEAEKYLNNKKSELTQKHNI